MEAGDEQQAGEEPQRSGRPDNQSIHTSTHSTVEMGVYLSWQSRLNGIETLTAHFYRIPRIPGQLEAEARQADEEPRPSVQADNRSITPTQSTVEMGGHLRNGRSWNLHTMSLKRFFPHRVACPVIP